MMLGERGQEGALPSQPGVGLLPHALPLPLWPEKRGSPGSFLT